MEEFYKFIDNQKKSPHLVILGSGATKAVIPKGDKNGKKTACMDNFLKELRLENILDNVDLKCKSNNIEDIYSELWEREDCVSVKDNLEKKIYEYFKSLEIPDTPILYDLLLLSLRETDCIASFNWDDILIQAYQRVCRITTKLPQLVFLHGNVSAGGCPDDHEYGRIPRCCHVCDQEYIPSPLLYPIKNKDYTLNRFIKTQWEIFEYFIRKSGKITTWGYNAPSSDIEAKEKMEIAFSTQIRLWQEFEIIDTADENVLNNNWSYFGEKTHDHLRIVKSFFKSSLAEFPRRSVEGYHKRNLGGWWGTSTISFREKEYTFEDLAKLIAPLLGKENIGNFEVI